MTNFDRIQRMNEEQMTLFLGAKIDCGNCPKRDSCKNSNLSCFDNLINWLKEDIGITFNELNHGQTFRVNPKDENIYIKTAEIIDRYDLIWNGVNLKTGLPVIFSEDELVFVEKIPEIDK